MQPDTIVPNPADPQALNRYSYVRNNALRYIDPSGHFSEEELMNAFGVSTWDDVLAFFEEGGAFAGLWGWLGVLREAELGMSVLFTAKYGEQLFWGKFSERAGKIVLDGSEIVEWTHPEWGCRQVSHFKQTVDLRFREISYWGKLSFFQTRSPMARIRLDTHTHMSEEYFDPYRKYERTKVSINLGNVDWGGAALDTAGLALSLFEATPLGMALGLATGSTDVARTVGMYRQGKATLVDVIVDVAGEIPVIGGATDAIDLVTNLGSAVESETKP